MTAQKTLFPAMRAARLAGAVLLGLVLSACSNDPYTSSGKDLFERLKSLRTSMASAPKVDPALAGQPVAIDPNAVAQLLAATKDPVLILVPEATRTPAPLVRLQKNGHYETYGSPARQSVTLRSGVLAATRGLGDDLMSAELSNGVAHVRGRKAGRYSKTLTYLDGEDRSLSLRLNCSIQPAARNTVPMGGKTVTVTQMVETCEGSGQQIQQVFVVDDAGRVHQSRQWLGRLNGYVQIQQLRF